MTFDEDSILYHYFRYILFFFIYSAVIITVSSIWDIDLVNLIEPNVIKLLIIGFISGEYALKIKRDGVIYGSFRITSTDTPWTFYPLYILLWVVCVGSIILSIILNIKTQDPYSF